MGRPAAWPVADPEALFTGWSPSPTAQWGTVFSVDPEIDAGFTFGLPVSEPTGQDAYDNTLDKDVTLSLTQAQRVHFSLVDDTVLDNRGGVSIRLLPELGVAIGLAAGIALLGPLARRRRKDLGR